MDAQDVTLGLAFLAGLLSFASPCVLPLVPAYVGYLSGTTVIKEDETGDRRETLRTFLHSLMFVLGFGLVFVLLGATATFFGRFVFDSAILLQRVGGVLLVVFGMRLMAIDWGKTRWIIAAAVAGLASFVLNSGAIARGGFDFANPDLLWKWAVESVMMILVVLAGADWGATRQAILAIGAGILNFISSYDAFVPNLLASVLIALVAFFLNRTDFFYSEKRFDLEPTEHMGYMRSLLFGVVFAAGWTPCVGPILAAILVVAGQLDTIGQGVLLLAVYTLGLGIPFLLVGLAFGSLSNWLRRLNRYVGIVSIASGILLVLMGLMIFTNSLAFLARYGTFFELGL